MWEGRGAVAAADTYFIEERARVAAGDSRRIPDDDVLTALNERPHDRQQSRRNMEEPTRPRDLAASDELCPACGAASTPGERYQRPFAIDVESIEDGAPTVDAEVVC
jgi:hypothetical protein